MGSRSRNGETQHFPTDNLHCNRLLLRLRLLRVPLSPPSSSLVTQSRTPSLRCEGGEQKGAAIVVLLPQPQPQSTLRLRSQHLSLLRPPCLSLLPSIYLFLLPEAPGSLVGEARLRRRADSETDARHEEEGSRPARKGSEGVGEPAVRPGGASAGNEEAAHVSDAGHSASAFAGTHQNEGKDAEARSADFALRKTRRPSSSWTFSPLTPPLFASASDTEEGNERGDGEDGRKELEAEPDKDLREQSDRAKEDGGAKGDEEGTNGGARVPPAFGAWKPLPPLSSAASPPAGWRASSREARESSDPSTPSSLSPRSRRLLLLGSPIPAAALSPSQACSLAVSSTKGFPVFWRRVGRDEEGGFREADVLGRILTPHTLSSFFRPIASDSQSASECGVSVGASPLVETPVRQLSRASDEKEAQGDKGLGAAEAQGRERNDVDSETGTRRLAGGNAGGCGLAYDFVPPNTASRGKGERPQRAKEETTTER
ncbi:hypothetical protein BESB_017450 [Besnoitia besnoiti]|uniref:Uncharacterized protein n=1 Tax=Besnoitia besnoiti TaxID=94643 RepID=A0A2A9M9Z0_BESBE|nr:hypothetical protein BESB_017450 [Besnoitia besnoiti]PFH32427.1 hypothetical protein BESB_017450 [Besnoitia besnoiti]